MPDIIVVFTLTAIIYLHRGLIQFFQDIILYGFSTFLPSILKLDLGFSSREAQYLSVPVYLLGGITFFVSPFTSKTNTEDVHTDSIWLLCSQLPFLVTNGGLGEQ